MHCSNHANFSPYSRYPIEPLERHFPCFREYAAARVHHSSWQRGVAAAVGAFAQLTEKAFRIGFLSGGSEFADGPNLTAFRRGMGDLGYTEGKTFTIEARFADGKFERLPSLVSELLALNSDVLIQQLSTLPKSEGEAVLLYYVVPADAPIELRDSGMSVFVHADATLATLAAQYHVPLWLSSRRSIECLRVRR